VVLIIILLALQSCQFHQEAKLGQAAALYNTQLGLVYLTQGDWVLAKRKLLIALSQNPNSPDVNAAMAYFLEKTGDVVKAQSYYRKAMLLAPGRGAQLNNYGAFLCRQKHYQQADHYFLLAVRDMQYERTAAAYENAGLCAMMIPDYKKAQTYFKKALMHDPRRMRSMDELKRMNEGNVGR